MKPLSCVNYLLADVQYRARSCGEIYSDWIKGQFNISFNSNPIFYVNFDTLWNSNSTLDVVTLATIGVNDSW